MLTGSLGQVMQESAARGPFLRALQRRASSASRRTSGRKHDIHVHIPAGAQPKDGPSAGVTMACALASLVTGKPVRADLGMTGEITLARQGPADRRGEREGAGRAPRRPEDRDPPPPQRAGLEDVPEEVRQEMEFIFADTVADVLQVGARGQAPRAATASRLPRRRARGAGRLERAEPAAHATRRGQESLVLQGMPYVQSHDHRRRPDDGLPAQILLEMEGFEVVGGPRHDAILSSVRDREARPGPDGRLPARRRWHGDPVSDAGRPRTWPRPAW